MFKPARSPLTRTESLIFLLLAAVVASPLCLLFYSPNLPAASGPVARPYPEVRHPRICAAVVVYALGRHDDWMYRAVIAQTALNAFNSSSTAPDCGNGAGAVLSGDFSPTRWQQALDVVDAVASGDYVVAPEACARAVRIVPLDPSLQISLLDAQDAARAQCVVHDLAFVEAAP